MVGIVSYGFYVPRYRVTVEEIATQNRKNARDIQASLGLTAKAVAGFDEDSVTMSLEAASMAIDGFDRHMIDLVFFGSETHPYAVKPASTIIGEWLDVGNDYNAYDTQFACKAATGAFLSALSGVKAGDARLALVCAADKATGKPGDALEYTAGSAAVALLLGAEKVLLEVLGSHSYSSDTPDFWRRHGASYPSHAERFTGIPAYFRHITEASTTLLEKLHMKPEDFTHAVFHMPNGRFPVEVSKRLGFRMEQLEKSLVVRQLGNSYAACAFMGLAATLDHAQPGDTIFFCSYGSGAGSDAMAFRVTEEIMARRRSLKTAMEQYTEVNYAHYLRLLQALK